MAKAVGFTRDAAARTARAVREVERMGGSKGGGWYPYRGDDGSVVRVGKATAKWGKGTCQTIKVWEQGEDCKPRETQPTEEIEDVANLIFDIDIDQWVLVVQSAKGKWYVIAAGGDDNDDSCRKTIGGEDFTAWPGWNENVKQVLGHDESGCLVWFNTTDCQDATTP